LIVRVHNEQGEATDSATWRYDPLGTWSRCAD
jgi:hypothetical protein